MDYCQGRAISDIQDASGCLQLCGGQISGIEAAVHAVRTAFDSEVSIAALLADASNAFNSLNPSKYQMIVSTHRYRSGQYLQSPY